MSLKEKFSVGDLVTYVVPDKFVRYFGFVQSVEDNRVVIEVPFFTPRNDGGIGFDQEAVERYGIEKIDVASLLITANELSEETKFLREEVKKQLVGLFGEVKENTEEVLAVLKRRFKIDL